MRPPWLPPDMTVWHFLLFLAVFAVSIGVFVVLSVALTHVEGVEKARRPVVEYDYGEEEWEPAPAVKVTWQDLPALAGFRHIRQAPR